MTSEKMPKSPWSRGEEFAKKAQEEGMRIHKEKPVASVSEQVDPHQEESMQDFRANLIEAGDRFSYTYKTENGVVDDPGPENGPDLLSCSSFNVKRAGDGMQIWATVEDLRQGAERISKRFPDIHFSFEENATRTSITYTAELRRENAK